MNSSAPAMAALIATAGYLFASFLIQGFSCQSVWLNSSATQSISGCRRGLISEEDNYIYKGTVNATASFLSNLIDFQIKVKNETDFKSICTGDLITCATPSSKLCYCASKIGDIYEVVLNKTATYVENNADIRIRWTNVSGDNLVVSNILRLPDIYDLRHVTSMLTIDGVNTSCPVNVTHLSVFKLSCVNSPSPCNVTITLDNTTPISANDVVTLSVPTNVLATTSHFLKCSYYVCKRTANSFECEISIVPGPSLCTFNCKDWGIALLVIFIIDIIFVIGVGIRTLWLLKKNDSSYQSLKQNIRYAITENAMMCILFVLVTALDFILVIIFAAEDPCICLEASGTRLDLWKIMLIIFCIANVAFIFLPVMLVFVKRNLC